MTGTATVTTSITAKKWNDHLVYVSTFAGVLLPRHHVPGPRIPPFAPYVP
ncbi:putative two component sensor kinase [Streptomyces viridochromogenes Tue57]|uniref:Putative two component sensor kinase n=1 Tax=Streptomyces viridochromogenes Tue57 TaxID=1160705 RepID=L8PGA1_STRVR|nr:putative two component sensor kinase [Streptomyces viridochromogenes Tue57]